MADGWTGPKTPALSPPPPPNICKPLLVSPPRPRPSWLLQPVCCSSRRQEKPSPSREEDRKADGQTVAKRKPIFFVDAIFNEHRHRPRCAHSGRKQQSRKGGCNEHRETPSRASTQRASSSPRICLRISFSRTLSTREWRTSTLASLLR